MGHLENNLFRPFIFSSPVQTASSGPRCWPAAWGGGVGTAMDESPRDQSGGETVLNSNRHLVVFDFPGIKNFVFGTNRLVEIRGASALLDSLNRQLIPSEIATRFEPERGQCVFAGGGAGQLVIWDSHDNIDRAIHEIRGIIYQKSGGSLKLAAGVASWEKEYRFALQKAFLNLENQKRVNPVEPRPELHCGFIRECDSCSAMAWESGNFGDEKRYLCRTCIQKETMGKGRGLWHEFAHYLEQKGIAAEKTLAFRPDDFDSIGDRCRSRRGYTALVYGDGNAMGRLLKKIDSKDRFERFSKIVDGAIREACHEALWSHCREVDGKIPADILLLGGDDVMIYLAADAAMPFATELARRFEDKTKEKFNAGGEDNFFSNELAGRGLTLSIGIAYGKSHTPISILVDQAEELLQSAKKKGSSLAAKNSYTPSCLDFHLTSRFSQASVADSRGQHLTLVSQKGERISLYQGPYTLKEAEALLDNARKLKESGIPSSRLHRLGEAPFRGKTNGTIETLILYGRSSGYAEKPQRLAIWEALDGFGCMDSMPWHRENENQLSTVLVDLVDIATFTAPG